jgi:glycolate oxidase iron-sulfur subunit
LPEDGTVTAPHPTPDVVSLAALADQCVQCGLCLPTCPTYGLEALEAESPRGRIALIKAWETSAATPTPAGDAHLDACLGCRRCEAVCPAGVQYGHLLTGARTRQRARRPAPARQRAAEWLTSRPRTLAALLAAYRVVWPLLPRWARPLPRPPAPAKAAHEAPVVATHATAALFLGCIARSYDAPLHVAVRRLGAAAGLQIIVPDAQTCCGSLHAHAGDAERTAALATANRAAFAGQRSVLGLASGCHQALADSLRGQCDVGDAIAVFAEHADRFRFADRIERIALHLPCSQRNVVRSDGALRTLLTRVPGLEVVALDAGFGCCGAAGTQMLTAPDRAARFRQPLLDQFATSGATRLLSANIGCRLHLANGTGLPVQHPLEFLAECLA